MIKIAKAGKIVGVSILVVAVLIIIAILIGRGVNTSKTKISKETGIQEQIFIKLGGIEQHLQIRGENINNPVVIFLHGGPGYPLSYLSYYYQPLLESDYTFIQWDQRGAGRTYYKNQTELSFNLLLSDLDELVEYTKERFNCEQVIIMGQSWGTVLGLTYAQQHPENVSAYIGVGQVIDFDEGKVYSAQKAINLANKAGKKEDVQALKAAIEVFKNETSIDEVDIDNLETLIITSGKYLTGSEQMGGLKTMSKGVISPIMTKNDLTWFLNVSDTNKIFQLEKELINYMYYEFNVYDLSTNFEVPIYFIQGSHDYITPTGMVQEYNKAITAPQKGIIFIENTGHTPFLDKPVEFSRAVKELIGNTEK